LPTRRAQIAGGLNDVPGSLSAPKGEAELRAAARAIECFDRAAVQRNDAPTGGETKAEAGEVALVVEPLKWHKQFRGIFGVKSDPVVCDARFYHRGIVCGWSNRNLDTRRVIF
jgi:hypothetical protein